MPGRRGCPPGARPEAKDLKTPQIGQFFHFAALESHGNHKVNAQLFRVEVYQLLEKERIHACMPRSTSSSAPAPK